MQWQHSVPLEKITRGLPQAEPGGATLLHGGALSAPPPPPPPAPAASQKYRKKDLQLLLAAGVPLTDAAAALELTEGDVDQALMWVHECRDAGGAAAVAASMRA